jgi:hypothetical protein
LEKKDILSLAFQEIGYRSRGDRKGVPQLGEGFYPDLRAAGTGFLGAVDHAGRTEYLYLVGIEDTAVRFLDADRRGQGSVPFAAKDHVIGLQAIQVYMDDFRLTGKKRGV